MEIPITYYVTYVLSVYLYAHKEYKEFAYYVLQFSHMYL